METEKRNNSMRAGLSLKEECEARMKGTEGSDRPHGSRSRSISKKKDQVRHYVISSSSSSSRSRSRSSRSSSSSTSSSRSKSRHRRDSRSRHRKHSKKRHRSSSKSKSRSRSGSAGAAFANDRKQRFGTSTNSTDPQSVASRIFIGNLPYDTTKDDVDMIYGKYGKILGMTILKGFAFVQFEKEENARAAVTGERGSALKGFQLDVKLATDGKKKGPFPGPLSSKPDDKEPSSDKIPRSPPPRGGEPAGYRPPPPRGLPPPPPGHPYGLPPYFRPPMPGHFPGLGPLPPPDHFRRHPFDPYGDPFDYPPFPPHPGFPPRPPPPRAIPPPSIDCEILVVDIKQRSYADSIKKRLMAAGIVTEMNVLAPDVDVMIALEEATHRRLLFAVVINEQNEIHRSITVNILHGMAQEHRNMPVDDAITLITRSFDKYVLERRDRGDLPPPGPPLGPPVAPELDFLPAGPRVQYLLNLLADQRFLTVTELSTVIDYLVERRRVMEPPARTRSLSEERRDDRDRDRLELPPDARRNRDIDDRQSYVLPPQGHDRDGGVGEPRRVIAELPVAPVPTPVPAASTAPPSTSLAQIINTSINFDNPTVKQALDNLISSGSNLFRGISDR